MTDYWYNALREHASPGTARGAEPGTHTSEAKSGAKTSSAEDARDDAILPRDLPPPSLAEDIRRLARENERMTGYMETLLKRLDEAQADRAVLQARLERLNDLVAAQGEIVGQQLRRELTGELKPILLAIVNLLELTAGRANGTQQPRTSTAPSPSRPWPPKPGFTPCDEAPRTLPAILTSPLEDLLAPTRAPSSSRATTERSTRAAHAPSKASPAAGNAGTFSWTSFFSVF